MMDENRLFDPTLSTLERTRQLGGWLRACHDVVLGDLEADLVTWLLDRHAAKLPLDLVLDTEGLPVFLNPHHAKDLPPLVDDEQELAFVSRFSSLGEDRARKLQLSLYRYMAFMDIIEPDGFFPSQAAFEAERTALVGRVGRAQDPPVFDLTGFALLVAHDWGLPVADAVEYERLHTLFLAAMGLVDFENDAAGDSPSLATGDDRPDLAPSLRERLG